MTVRRRMALAALAGAAAALGHAPFGLWSVALAGFAALIWLVSSGGSAPTRQGRVPPEYFTQEEGRARRSAACIAWAGGAGYFAVALHWIVEPFLVDVARHGWMAPFALILMAGGLALFWAAAGWFAARLSTGAPGFALALAGAEILRGHVLTGFPWALPAYVWADTPLRMLASVIGPYGLTALTLVIAALPSSFGWWPWKRAPGIALVLVSLAALWPVSGAMVPDGTGSLGVVRLVQPNAPQDEKWDPDKARIFVERAIAFTAEPGQADLVVWPESAIPYPLDLAAPVLELAAEAARGAPVISGLNRRTDTGDWFNAMAVVGADGRPVDVYDKVHLVPFGEYIPFRIGLLRDLAGFSGFGFTPGAAVRLVGTPLGRALPLICYEAIFPRHGAGAGRPDYLLQITNDAWFGTFSGPYQHLDQARFRAVEQGVSLIRAANTGVSAVIDPAGRIVASLPLGEAGRMDVAVPSPRAPTVYSGTGDLPAIVLLLAALGVLSLAGHRNAIAKPRDPK